MKKYILSKEEKSRIDIIKFIAIIFVVYIHSYYTSSIEGESMILSSWLIIYQKTISSLIARCGVPIFFLISAILFFSKERKYSSVIKSKLKTIVIPYLFWNTFWITIWIFLQQIALTKNYFGVNDNILNKDIAGLLHLYGIGQVFPAYPLDYPLWFMRDLFIIFLISPLLKLVISKFTKTSFLIGVIMTFLPDFWFKTVLSYFLIGGSVVYLDFHFTILDKISLSKLSLGYFGFILILILMLIFEFPFRNVVINFFVLFSVLFWFRVSKKIYDCKRIRLCFLRLSNYTLIIYVFHEMTLSCVKKVTLKLFPTSDLFIFMEYNIVPLIVIVVCILVGMMMKKNFPKIYSISMGGR
ncbi:acyltransferase [Turicibacter sanguinis]|uniref:acyltransferase n=1 Tax=Turicibacter sanguinis TaxID=154288 RepID=UPI00325B7CCC